MAKIYEERELADALRAYQETQNYAEVARRLGIARTTAQYRVEQAVRRNVDASAILKDHEDTLPPGMEISGVSQHFPQLGWVKMKPVRGLENAAAAIHGAFREYDGMMVPRPRNPVTNGNLLTLYPIPDVHLGMLSWRKETGEAYDIDIASRLLREKAGQLVLRTPNSDIGVVLVLGDFFHADDNSAATPEHGNPLDVDSRHQKVFHRGVEVLLDVIELARGKHKRVIVRVLPGNHDPISSHALTDALYWAYRMCPEVEVDIDPGDFWEFRFGRTMIAAHHGHEVKPGEFASTMAAYWPEDWGQADVRYGLMGHLHQHMKIPSSEKGGAEIEVLQALCAKDAWNRGMGHSAGRSLSAMVYRYDGGEDVRYIERVRPEDME